MRELIFTELKRNENITKATHGNVGEGKKGVQEKYFNALDICAVKNCCGILLSADARTWHY